MRPSMKEPALEQGIPPLIRRNTLYLALTQALQGATGQLAVTFGAVMVLQLLGSASLTGIGGSIIGLSRFAVAYPIGKLTDAYGRRIGAFVALVFGMIGSIMLGFSIILPSFPIFLVGILILGLGTGAAMQMRVAAADMYPPDRRAEGLGYVLTGSVAGAVIATILVVLAELTAGLTEVDSKSIAWFIVPLVLIPAVILVQKVNPDPKVIAENLDRYWPSYRSPPIVAATSATGNFRTFIRHRPKQVAYACYTAAQGTMSMMMVMTPLVMVENNHTLSAISIAFSIHVTAMYAFSIPIGRLADRIGRRILLGAGLGTEVIGAILVPVSPYYWIITLGLFLVGLGWSAVNVSSTAILVDTSTPEERGRAVGTNDMLAGAITVGTPLMGGLVVASMGLMGVGLVGAALALAPMFVLGRLRELSPGRYESTTPVR